MTTCPICGYPIDECQCLSPDGYKSKIVSVVMDHLYMLSNTQIAYIKNLQKKMEISYEDPEKQKLLKELEDKYYTVDAREFLSYFKKKINEIEKIQIKDETDEYYMHFYQMLEDRLKNYLTYRDR